MGLEHGRGRSRCPRQCFRMSGDAVEVFGWEARSSTCHWSGRTQTDQGKRTFNDRSVMNSVTRLCRSKNMPKRQFYSTREENPVPVLRWLQQRVQPQCRNRPLHLSIQRPWLRNQQLVVPPWSNQMRRTARMKNQPAQLRPLNQQPQRKNPRQQRNPPQRPTMRLKRRDENHGHRR